MDDEIEHYDTGQTPLEIAEDNYRESLAIYNRATIDTMNKKRAWQEAKTRENGLKRDLSYARRALKAAKGKYRSSS